MSKKTFLSPLIERQLPEYVREEYPKFVAFVEAYYEYLEQHKQGIDVNKHLLDYADIDKTLDEFEDYFYRTFLPLIPRDTIVDKRFLVKHIKQFYTARGTEKAFKFLFRALYGEEIDLVYPKDQVLRASDGKWRTQKTLRVLPQYYTETLANGIANTYTLFATTITSDTVRVFIDGIQQYSGYSFSPNEPRITFDTPPTANAVIKFLYSDDTILNRINTGNLTLKFIGEKSQSECISEYASRTIVAGTSLWEIYITELSTIPFRTDEVISARVYLSETEYQDLKFESISVLQSIDVIDGGAGYVPGTPVPLIGGNPDIVATAEIESVYSAVITNIIIKKRGAGFLSGGYVNIIAPQEYVTANLNVSANGLNVAIKSVDSTGTYHPNTISFNSDIIRLYQNLAINVANYNFPAAGVEDQNTVIANALSYLTISNLGPISELQIIKSNYEFATQPTLKADPVTIAFSSANATGSTANSILNITQLGILGHMTILSPGQGYQVGDEIQLTPNPRSTGWGGAAMVTGVYSANGGISEVQFQPARIVGTGSTVSGDTTLVGTGTAFTTELKVNDRIRVNTDSRYVASIANDTYLTVNVAWSSTSTNRSIGHYNRTYVGGTGYVQFYLPQAEVTSANPNASGAQIEVDAIYGDGDVYDPRSIYAPGQIKTIRVLSGGKAYASPPQVDLTQSGNGLAEAIANVLAFKFTYPGKFVTTDGLLSSNRRLQDKNYYQNYSYVIQANVEFSKYKNALLTLLHPSGMKVFGQFILDEQTVTANTSVSPDDLIVQGIVSGTVNVASGSTTVTGIGTTFNTYASRGLLRSGVIVTANNEGRVVDGVINNTSLLVTVPFTYTANNVPLHFVASLIVGEGELESLYLLITQSGSYLITESGDYITYL